MTVTDFPDYAEPQANATAIAGTGVPLLAGPVELYRTGFTTIPAGGTDVQILNNMSVYIQSMAPFLTYEITINQTGSFAGTLPFAVYTLHWFADALGAAEVYRETWCTTYENTGAGQFVIGVGPCRGGYLGITVTNADGAQSFNINNLIMSGNARPAPLLQPDWRNYPLTLATSGLVPMGSGGNVDGILGILDNYVLAAGASAIFLFGVYNGTVLVNFGIGGAAPNVTLAEQAYVVGRGLGQLGVQINYTAAGQSSFNAWPPRGPLMIKATNNNGASPVTLSFSSVALTQF